jgi:methylmalonyl-CoA mutase
MVILGGVIPLQDYDELYAKGTTAIFGPGTIITNAADKILDDLLARSTSKVA